MIFDRDAAGIPSRRAHPRGRGRAGLTLIEIVVVSAVLLILMAALAPGMIGVLDRKRVESAAESLDAIAAGMTSMRGDQQDWPGLLSHLTVPIVDGVDRNICGNTYQGKANKWTGPYLDRVVPATGFPIGIGTVQDTLVREIISGNDAFLKIQINDVMEEDALALDKIYDDDGASGGTIRWTVTSPSTGQVTLYVARPIRGC